MRQRRENGASRMGPDADAVLSSRKLIAKPSRRSNEDSQVPAPRIVPRIAIASHASYIPVRRTLSEQGSNNACTSPESGLKHWKCEPCDGAQTSELIPHHEHFTASG
ncbi:hypothetical protein MRB53_042279 [Persea americana]|nr:hypothetical protein MRB53_042279 [Persea americana]